MVTSIDAIQQVLMDTGHADLVPALLALEDAAERGRLREIRTAMQERALVDQIEWMRSGLGKGWAARQRLERLERNHKRSVRYFLARVAKAEQR